MKVYFLWKVIVRGCFSNLVVVLFFKEIREDGLKDSLGWKGIHTLNCL